MKKLFLVAVVLLAATNLFAQIDYTKFQESFNDFAQDLARSAPMATTTGLGWSQAYIGQFPHFGLGLTVGATTITPGAMKKMADSFGVTLPSDFSTVNDIGLPLPSYTIDARIGGFVWPFDIGLKLGYIPPDAFKGSQVSINYLLFGFDVRYALLEDEGWQPAVSVGLGYNRTNASVSVPGIVGDDIRIANVQTSPTTSHTLALKDPDLGIEWSTNVIELKVQVSKKLVFITPYLGLGAGLSFGGSASGGVTSQLLYDGHAISQAEINQIKAYYQSQGQTPPDFSTTGITAESSNNTALDFRAFGGLSVNLFVLYLDFGGGYDISTGSWGIALNTRLVF